MKKTLAIIITVTLTITFLAACGSSEPEPALDPGDSFDASRVIGVHTREDGSGTRDAFVSITGVGDDMYSEAVILASTNEILSAVGANDYAIGYISVGSLNDSVKALTIGGIAPSDATIKNGSYIIQRPLLVCVTDEKYADPLVKDFIDFMLSAAGQEQSATSWTSVDDSAPNYEPSGMAGILRIGGSTSVDPLMQRMREEYLKLNDGVTIDISSTGSGAGISGAADGELDIGMSSRELREGELETLTPIDIALDGVAVVVNPANPISDLSLEQVKEIYTGEIVRWEQLQ